MFELWSIKDIINKHKGKPAIIAAHGPSGDENIDKINDLHKKNKVIIFGMNEWWAFKDHPTPDYWIRCHTGSNGGWHMEKENDQSWFQLGTCMGNVPFLNADTVDRTPLSITKKVINGPYLPYDTKHVGGKTCEENYEELDRFMSKRLVKFFPECCDRKGRLTIQEELSKYCDYDELISASPYTVSVYAIIFGILMGCNPIYINGMELDYDTDAGCYGKLVDDKDWKTVFPDFQPGPQVWKGWRREWMEEDFNIINKSAENIGVEIINLNPNTWYKSFEVGIINGKNEGNSQK
tara:strand:- start:242 stop:1120 length:879 start_codon:yes stop_codon:yes gene_type:complete